MQLNCSDGTPLVFVAGDMPTEMRESLERNLRNAFTARVSDECTLRDRDSKTDANGDTFSSCHFSYYARFGTSVSTILPTMSSLLFISMC